MSPPNSSHFDAAPMTNRRRSATRLGDDAPFPLMAALANHQRPPSLSAGALPVTQDNTQQRDASGHDPDENSPRVVWTRSAQCRTLAEVLGGGTAHRADADMASACIRARAALLVARHLSSFDLCNIAVPHGFSPATTRSVVAAVGSGPHSQIAATIAHRLSTQLGIPARAVYGHSRGSERPQALAVLGAIAARLPDLALDTIEALHPAAMVSALPAGTLLVVGAPGGSWFQRQFFGPGARIQAKAPNGTIVVRHTPTRIYQIMQPPTAFGPHMRVADATKLAADHGVIVAQDGQLLGIASTEALNQARPDLELQEVMGHPVFLTADEDLDRAAELITHHHGSPIPVVDAHTRLIGTVATADLKDPPLQ